MDERSEILRNYRKHQKEERENELLKNSKLINDFIDFCSTKKIKLSADNFDYIQTIGIVAKYPNIVGLLNNRIQPDKEELVNVSKLEDNYTKQPFASGYYYSDKYMIMAHPYFRRGHHENSNFSPRFVDIFWSFNKPNNEKYISIDNDRVRINVDNLMYIDRKSVV